MAILPREIAGGGCVKLNDGPPGRWSFGTAQCGAAASTWRQHHSADARAAAKCGPGGQLRRGALRRRDVRAGSGRLTHPAEHRCSDRRTVGHEFTRSAGWTGRQLMEACGPEDSPRYLIRDRDQVYGERFSRRARMLDIRETVTAPRFAVAKRLCRARDWLDSTRMSGPYRDNR